MAYIATEQSYIGKGSVFIGLHDGSDALREIGNVSALTISASEEEKALKDFTSAGGGNANSVRRVDKVEVAMTLHDLSAKNLALASFGTTSAVTAATVTDESHANARAGGLIRTAFPIDTAIAPVVKVGATTHVADVDYKITPAGPIVLAGGAINDNDTVLVSYTKDAASVVQALINPAQNYRISFVGLNEAQSGKPVIVDMHKVKLGALASLPLIGDDFAGLEIKGEALSDSAITGAGLSKFYAVTQVS